MGENKVISQPPLPLKAPTLMKPIIAIATCVAVLFPVITTSCKEKGEVVHTKAEKSAPPAPMSAGSPHSGKMGTPTTTAGNPSAQPTATAKAKYTWTLPDGWSDQPASGMRLATIIIPVEGNTLNASITEFGGDLIGNVNRWRGQIGLTSATDAEIQPSLQPFKSPLAKDGKGYIVSLVNPASPEKSMLAAIIPRPTGTSVFVKITGTKDELKAVATPFRTFMLSLK